MIKYRTHKEGHFRSSGLSHFTPINLNLIYLKGEEKGDVISTTGKGLSCLCVDSLSAKGCARMHDTPLSVAGGKLEKLREKPFPLALPFPWFYELFT